MVSVVDNVLCRLGWMLEATVVPDMEVGGREAMDMSESTLPMACKSGLSDKRPAPAAAIICGLSGLDDELARLPFREC